MTTAPGAMPGGSRGTRPTGCGRTWSRAARGTGPCSCPRTGPCAGRHHRRTARPPRGPDASAWCGALRRTTAPWIPGQSSPRPRGCRTALHVAPRIAIARPRSPGGGRPPATGPPPRGLRAPTDATALGWRAVTGRRSRALVALQHDDVDRGHGRLTRRPTTFGQSRCLPLHPTTRQALWGDGPLRARGEPLPNTPSCVVAAQGPRVPPWTVRATFVPRACQLGWRDPTDSYGPRLHDFRPRVAVQTLGRWSRDGVDGERPLPARSTALGQVQGSDPSWYLRATPPVLGLVTPRLEPAPRGPTSGPRPSPVRACWHPASPRAWYATSRPVPPPLPATATPSACCGAVPSHGCTTRLQP